jgi:hypothetical protein
MQTDILIMLFVKLSCFIRNWTYNLKQLSQMWLLETDNASVCHVSSKFDLTVICIKFLP